MLSNIMKEHSQRMNQRRDELEYKRKVAINATNEFTSLMMDHLNVGVAQAYLNQKKLDSEAKQLAAHSQQLLRQSEQWANLLDGFHKILKEIGDVDNWARTIEADMKTVSSALEYAYNVDKQECIQQTSRESPSTL
ncbi:biogenesis of lysosome-related organelles complex 1 subunit 1-like [Varroa jacobsoni]|nr:biogenesis of lysosome-related organelles complex 1 subunit 1-like isoform X2 [Varroa destructor]XP_022694519.1 biogenesis of lysosome-related organelles complex 1 subunit 1-like [Varroa jacobsoni]XP_022694521.1 biogenesis of lysosome-related organelles complex 1 subunit 1-like [Varroa jacobsoni]XP_022694522.1 biogenesis of lysosome-related organelles complex 1 subunit 1-like [Varroa jacobsoni]